jgi:hypothetical protein
VNCADADVVRRLKCFCIREFGIGAPTPRTCRTVIGLFQKQAPCVSLGNPSAGQVLPAG